MGLLSARACAKPCLPLGRRWAAGDHRSRMPALLRARTLERSRPYPEGTPLRTDRTGRKPRGGRQGVLFLSRFVAHSLLPERRFTSTRRQPFRTINWSARIAAADLNLPEYELIDTGVFEGEPLFRRVRRVRQAELRTIFISGSLSRIARTNPPRSSFCRLSGFAIPGSGAARTKAALSNRESGATKRAGSRPNTKHSSRCISSTRQPTSFFSPKTKQIFSAFTASRTTRPFVKDSFHDLHRFGRQIGDQSGSPRDQGCSGLSPEARRRRITDGVSPAGLGGRMG